MRSYVVKRLLSEGLGHDYPSDRAAVFLFDLDEYGNLQRHVRAVDVLAEMGDGTIRSIGGAREYYLLMEKAAGTDYFRDLGAFSEKKRLDEHDVKKIGAMAAYLAEIHSVKKDSKALYWRKLRDTIGHGECLMGVFDTYPDGTLSYGEMAEIEKKCVDWRARLKPFTHGCHRYTEIFTPATFGSGRKWAGRTGTGETTSSCSGIKYAAGTDRKGKASFNIQHSTLNNDEDFHSP